MPGANCSIFGCTTSRYTPEIAIFGLPRGEDNYNVQWRTKLVHIITKDRVIDTSLRKQIEKKNLHVCELHFENNNVRRHTKRTTLVPGSLPTLNLPMKSIQCSSTIVKPRSSVQVIETKKTVVLIPGEIPTSYYKSYENFVNRIKILKLPEKWKIEENSDYVVTKCEDTIHVIPQYEIYIQKTLVFAVRVYAWGLPLEHTLYNDFAQSVKNITLSQLITRLSQYQICSGVDKEHPCNEIHKHIVPKIFSPSNNDLFQAIHQTIYNRARTCKVLITSKETCEECNTTYQNAFTKTKKAEKRKSENLLKPASLYAPISLTSPERVILKLQNQRAEIKSLKIDVEKLKTEIEQSSVDVSSELNSDLTTIMSNAEIVSPFMRLFWAEQQKYIATSRKSVRYHPMIIRYCLALLARSPKAYEYIRYDPKAGTGFLVLPIQRRLRDYKNYIHPQRGFNPSIIKELMQKVEKFSDIENYVVLLFDEIKIQENLVWDKHTGELIGYVGLGDIDINYATLKNVEEIATHILVFMIRSIVNPFKFSLANFSTTGITSAQIFPLFWKAVGICELQCQLKVMATTCDGASPNRKFFRMHSKLSDEVNDTGVVYKTKNLFCSDRHIYFFADPHLIKTASNCLSNCGSGKQTRYMWNNGFYILWRHIYVIFMEDRECGLHLLPKLSYDHMKLSSYSIMNVKLAAQVLSGTVSKILENFGPADSAGTATFCSMMDNFFDIMNIRNTTEGAHKLKPFLNPFSSADDYRFEWLANEFLPYFQNWLQSIENRQGNFTSKAKNNMFISHQTHEGIKITVNSVVELVKYLLSHGVPYILTERLCQDPLENYFGHQRSMGARKDNPSVRDFGYNDNNIRNQKVFRPIQSGNSVENVALMEISDEPVPCRKKKLT